MDAKFCEILEYIARARALALEIPPGTPAGDNVALCIEMTLADCHQWMVPSTLVQR